MMNNISLGLCTFNRPDYAKQCLKALIKNNFGGATTKYLIDDCSEDKYKEAYEEVFKLADEAGMTVIRNAKNIGVGKSKNILLKNMLLDGCEHLFLMEDDIIMKNPTTCIQYIQCAQIYEVEHMNFALHGEMNKGRGFSHNGMMCYPNVVGAFSYYTKKVIEDIGFMDEGLLNCWEHVWHTLLISEQGLTTPFWKFVDHPNSGELLGEIPGSIDGSSIRPRVDWSDNIKKGQEYLVKKYGRWLPPREK